MSLPNVKPLRYVNDRLIYAPASLTEKYQVHINRKTIRNTYENIYNSDIMDVPFILNLRLTNENFNTTGGNNWYVLSNFSIEKNTELYTTYFYCAHKVDNLRNYATLVGDRNYGSSNLKTAILLNGASNIPPLTNNRYEIRNSELSNNTEYYRAISINLQNQDNEEYRNFRYTIFNDIDITEYVEKAKELGCPYGFSISVTNIGFSDIGEYSKYPNNSTQKTTALNFEPEKFNIIFYNNTSEDNRVDKTNFLTENLSINGYLREGASILYPEFNISLIRTIPNFNYAYIPYFNRYYFVDDIVSIASGLWRVNLRVDPLMSFKDQIQNLDCKILRQEFEYDNYLIDSEQPIENRQEIDFVSGTKPSYSTDVPTINTNELYDLNKIDEPLLVSGYITVGLSSYDVNPLGNITPTKVSLPIVNYYTFDISTFNSFCYVLYNTDASVFKPFTEPSECIRNIRVYPFRVDSRYRSDNFKTWLQDYVVFGNTIKDLPLLDYIKLQEGTMSEKVIAQPHSIIHPSDEIQTVITNRIVSNCALTVRGGSITIPKKYNNFLDQKPYTHIELYIPFVGWVDLPVNLVIGDKLHSIYYVDLETGSATNVIYNSKNEEIIINQCDIGYDIPIVRMNTTEMNKKQKIALSNDIKQLVGFISNTVSTVSGAKSSLASNFATYANSSKTPSVHSAFSAERGNIQTSGSMSILQDATNLVCDSINRHLEANFYKSTSGQSGDNVLINSEISLSLMAKIYRPIPINVPNYNHLVGKPSSYSGQLKNLNGYTQVGACHMEGFSDATPEEISIINNRLKSGFIL